MVKLFERCLKAKYIHTNECGDYAIQVEKNTIFILFQKSSGSEDWKNNFDFPARPYKNMKSKWMCHRGFLRVWKAMKDDIEVYVAEILKNHSEITNIVCIGYSHGAALCVFATEDMEYLYGDKYSVVGYGFGCPRVLWGVIPDDVKYRLRNFTAIRNIPDIVTHVPPMFLGFRHAGKLQKIGEKNKYNPIDAHRPNAYKNELTKLTKEGE